MQRYKLEIRNVDIKSIFDFQSKKRQLYKELHASEIHVKIRT